MTDLADLTLVEAAAAVEAGETSSAALLAACRAAVAASDSALNMTIWTEWEAAERDAAAADAACAAGPLHGVPLAHKDMFDQAGRRRSCGSAILRDARSEGTATAITRLSAAGAYAFAGLHMAEFAQNATGHNRIFGDCRNPWSPRHIPGGSSSGPGAAVAARCTTAALGSDTGGSIRIPAACCGVTGLKPTQGRVSRAGAMPLSFSNDNVGPLARTARDCARVLRVIAGPDPHDPACADLDVADYEAGLDGDLRGLRIAVPETHFLYQADADVMQAFESALRHLEARGAHVRRVAVPVMAAIVAYSGVVSRVEAATIHAQWMRSMPQAYAPHVGTRLLASYAISAVSYVEALSRRGPLLRAFAAATFADADVVATPTLRRCVPTLAETDIDSEIPGADERVAELTANTRPFNYLGLPAISLPCGFDGNGLPIGLQIAGRPFAEARILRLADAYQRDTDWHRRRPPSPPIVVPA